MAFKRSRFYLVSLTLLLALLAFAARHVSDWLVVDLPQRSDVIVVLAGETNSRPERALELLKMGYGRQIVLNVPAAARIFSFTELELAEKYKDSLPDASQISICPIVGLSTRDEARDSEKCLAGTNAKSVLIVTSDFHTRRARSVFQHEIPRASFSTAAAYDDTQFGARWWTRRQWAKTALDEGLKWTWWESVDRWR